MNIDDLIKALTAPFAAGFVVQRLLEILDPFTFAKIFPNPNAKKAAMGVISLAVGLGIAFAVPVEMFHPLLQKACKPEVAYWLDRVLSGVFISAGTEGFNTLLKFANYKKDANKADAANKMAAAGNAVKNVNP
jgi:hypothetical protein